MPIVHIEMYPGRTEIQKAFLARRIVDAVSEIAGTTREGVHVIFGEVARTDWAIGPRLASARTAPAPEPAAHLAVMTVRCKPGKKAEYLAWRRDAVYPYMARSEGFIDSTVMAVGDSDTDFVIVNKWASPEALERYNADPREADLRAQARELLDQLTETKFEGSVLDVFNGGWARPA